MRSAHLLLALAASAAALRLPSARVGAIESSVRASRRQVLALGVAHLGTRATAARAEEAVTDDCSAPCFKECNAVAPGNQGYCASQCEDYCASRGADAPKLDAKSSTPDTSKSLGMFGDSGVSYGNGLENLLATTFGATRQGKNVNKADVGAFTSDIAAAAVKLSGADFPSFNKAE